MATYKVSDETRTNFFMIPNSVDEMGLTVYAFRLYCHLKRVAGDDGKCWQSTRTLATACEISTGAISKAKDELLIKELIKLAQEINPKGGKSYHVITIINIWASSPGEQPSSCSELASSLHERSSSPGEIKKTPLIRHTKKEIAAVAATREPLTEGCQYILQAFGAKRFKTAIQGTTIAKLETDYGIDKLRECIDWAAKQGMTMGRAVSSIETAIKKWGHPKAVKPGGNGNGNGPKSKYQQSIEVIEKCFAPLEEQHGKP